MQGLTPKQQKGIIALLEQPTLKEAAAACGVNECTLWRWQQNPSFQRAYREARQRTTERALAVIEAGLIEAAQRLRHNLRCAKPAVEARVAEMMFSIVHKFSEMQDVEQRLSVLESLLADQSTAHKIRRA